jgi:hypothetical protein
VNVARASLKNEEILSDFSASYRVNAVLTNKLSKEHQSCQDGKSGRGGFEDSSYSNVYNGYRGFPERLTEIQEHPSVSWKDAGLPIKTSLNSLQ